MYFLSSLVIRYGMQTRPNCQSSYSTEQWWIFTRLCTPTKFYKQVNPPFDAIWGMIVYQIRLSRSRMVTLLSKIMDQQVEKKSYDTWCYFTAVKRFHSETHERGGSVSAWHFLIPLQGTKRRTTTGSAELFKNVISLIRVPMAHPNHNCQHAPRNTIRSHHMLPNFFL